MKVTFEEIIDAYQRVKTDIYFERNNDDLLRFVDFENDLSENLKAIYTSLQREDELFFLDDEIIGSYSIVLKDLEFEFEKNEIIESNELSRAKQGKIKKFTKRYVGKNSVTFHIISSLWIELIGRHLETEISSSSYGCRLREFSDPKEYEGVSDEERKHPVNGNFRPYAYDYKRWQKESLKATKDALSQKKKALVFSTDFRAFYHSISAEFLVYYYDQSVERGTVSADYEFLNHILYLMMDSWSSSVYNSLLKNEFELLNSTAGLPIGLSCSKVIANLVLKDFDYQILNKLAPIYYGRYVDDIILVLDNSNGFKRSSQVWEVLSKSINGIVDNQNQDLEEPYYALRVGNDILPFNLSKTTLFSVGGSTGEKVIDTIEKSMSKNSSEWRLMPDADDDLESLNDEILNGGSECSDNISSFSKFDGISVRRFHFALRLRNFESWVRNMDETVWRDGLNSFFETVIEFVVIPQNFSTYIRYIPRLFGLAVFANDERLFDKLHKTYNEAWSIIDSKLDDSESFSNKSVKEIKSYYRGIIAERIIASIHLKDSLDDIEWLYKYQFFKNLKHKNVKNLSERFFQSDFHRIPLKLSLLSDDIKLNKSTKLRRQLIEMISDYDILNNTIESKFIGIDILLKGVKSHSVNNVQLYLSTRKLTILELTYIYPYLDKAGEFKTILKSLGYNVQPPVKSSIDKLTNHKEVNFHSEINRDVQIVLTNLKTDESSWIAVVREDGFEPEANRDVRLNKLVNDILRVKEPIDFVVFPELSIPRNRILEIANKFRSRGTSLVVGIEYQIKDEQDKEYPRKGVKKVVNQLMYVITKSEGNFYSQYCILQDKTIPAHHEEVELYNTGGKVLISNSEDKYIIKHNNLVFSGLICNDLLNIDNRQPLRGNIDLLFVVEWNKDVDMYNHIVSSTANDLHCFVAQANNRAYGDTRLRAPFKKEFERDVARVKGGELDNFVLVKVEADALREFQRNYRSPSEPFKPVPTGFDMSELRRKTRINRKN